MKKSLSILLLVCMLLSMFTGTGFTLRSAAAEELGAEPISVTEEAVPEEESPAEEPVVEETAEEIAEETPAEEPAAEEPAEEAPVEEPGAEETAEEVPAEETAEEAPAEETPAEESSAEEPAEEILVEEVPAAEIAEEIVEAEETPVEDGAVGDLTVGDSSAAPVYGGSVQASYSVTIEKEKADPTKKTKAGKTIVAEPEYDFVWVTDADGAAEADAPEGVTVNLYAAAIIITNDAATPAGTYYFKLTYGDKTDVKTYTVAKRAATITSGSATKAYDGTPLTCETYEVSGFVNGEGVDVSFTGSQSEAGSSYNAFTYSAKSGTNLDNYAITKVEGKLTVTNNLFVVLGENYSGTYDGKEHKFNNVKVIYKNGIDYTSKATITYYTSSTGEDETWSPCEGVPSIKDAGKIYVKATASLTIGGQTTTLESAVYTMEVTKRTVTLFSASAEKEYDGTELTDDSLFYGSLAGGESFAKEPEATGTITKVGATANTIDITSLKVSAGGTDTTSNYEFVKNEGTLTVTPKAAPITITTASVSKVYDGFAVSDWGKFTYTQGILVNGEKLSVTYYCTGEDAVKDAGTYENSLVSYQVTDVNGENVTNCYTFAEPVYGTITIAKRNITLTSGNDLKVGQPGDSAYNGNVIVGGAGLAGDETLAYADFPTVTEVSYTPTENTFTYSAAPGSAFKESNYNVTTVYGKLMLVEEMSILGENQEFTYDGTEQKAPVTVVDNGQGAAVKVTYSTSTDNETWSAYSETVPSIKDAGVLYVRAKATKGVQEKDASYTVTMNPRAVTISTASRTKAYDGTALTYNDVTYGALAGGESFAKEPEATGTITKVGAQANTIDITSLKVSAGAKDTTSNYEFVKNEGTLTVTANQNPIVITTGSSTVGYNGEAIACSDWTASFNGQTLKPEAGAFSATLPGTGDTLIVCCTGSITNVGSAQNTCTYRVENAAGEDVTACYTFAEPELGTLKVTPRSIVITTGSAEKVYDGKALTCSGYTVSGDGFVEGEGFASVNVTGSRTNAGTAQNRLNYTFKEGTEAGNYTVSVKTGTLTVNQRKVVVSSGNAVGTYGATPGAGLSNSYCTVSGDGFVVGEMAEGYPRGSTILQKPASEPAPSNPAIAENAVEYKWTGNGNPANYEITENLGTLEIVNESDTAAVASNYVGIYDGKSHSGSFSSTITDPEMVEYSTDGGANWSQTEPTFTDVVYDEQGQVASHQVQIQVTKSGNVAKCSYTVTILPRELTLTAGSATKVYDGTPLTCSDITIGGDGFANGTELLDADLGISSTITDAGAIRNNISKLTDEGSFKTSNYDISYAAGTLTVTKRPVVLISGSYKALYDGIEHSVEKVITVGDKTTGSIKGIESMGFAEGEGASYSGFTKATNANTYPNAFSYKLNGNTKASNYNIKAIYGSITINPREVTLTSASDSQVYNGQALTNSKVTVSGDEFVAGEGAVFDVTGTQTEVGKSANTFAYELKAGTKASNYQITVVEGELEVTAIDIADCDIESFKKAFVADGQAITPALTVKDGRDELTENVDYTVSYENNIEVGTATATITGINHYRGTNSVTFTIVKLEDVVKLSNLGDYTEQAAKKNAVVTLGEGTVLCLEDLKAVSVDGEELTLGEDYKAEDGSIKITLYKSFLNTLKAGKHTLMVELINGLKYETEFTVDAAPVAKKQAPGTGDNSGLGLWIALTSASVLALGAVLTLKRKEHEGK